MVADTLNVRQQIKIYNTRVGVTLSFIQAADMLIFELVGQRVNLVFFV